MTTENGLNDNQLTDELTIDSYKSHRASKWCPGCGSHAVLRAVKNFLLERRIPPEKCVFVSGIGCSSRFPYYLNTYGFHTIHGRAPTIAAGIKLANPDLSVWIVTGDGDALSIGGNHFIHLLRRNLDINILLLNNRIYGLTKGQYSPTSEFGKITKSSPQGSPDCQIRAITLALASHATFVARTLDVDTTLMHEILEEAYDHKGTSLTVVYQDCAIFNKGAFDYVREKSIRQDAQLIVHDGQPMIFGKDRNKGLKLRAQGADIVEFNPEDPQGPEKAGVSIFNASNPYAGMVLASLPRPPEYPVPMGIFYKEQRPMLEDIIATKAEEHKQGIAPSSLGSDALKELFNSGDTWTVKSAKT